MYHIRYRVPTGKMSRVAQPLNGVLEARRNVVARDSVSRKDVRKWMSTTMTTGFVVQVELVAEE